MDELVSLEHDYRSLKDECEELRTKANETKKIEATLETFRRKISELKKWFISK